MALYAFDGTWNEEHDAGEYGRNTNVVRFHDLYQGGKELHAGVGTRYGGFGRFLGGAFGVGGRTRIRRARKALFESFRDGDRDVDIVGFSRGSALALHFSNVIARSGVQDPDSGEQLAREPEIRFLALWDVVAAFGIPINIGIPFQRINLGYRLRLPGNVRHCFHALALDERRQAFRPTRVEGGYEVWFRGVHSDVGGGNENLLLNNITLRWMLRKATAAGLPLDPAAADALEVDADAAIKPARFDPVENRPREVGAEDRVHYTVAERPDEHHNNPPPGAPRETEEMERRVSG